MTSVPLSAFLDEKPAPADLGRAARSEEMKALFRTIAWSVKLDHLLKSRRRQAVETELDGPSEVAAAPGTEEPLFPQLREQCLKVLARLPAKQRAALILCAEEWEWLKPQEGEPLLKPSLHWKTARAALAKRPLSGGEAKSLFGRDVSSYVSKAREKLAKEFTNWRRSREDPIGGAQTSSPPGRR
jgi:hypothetical protein